MIFIAVILPAMVLIMGLAIVGGKLFVRHQQLQAAADMAAIVGSQALPCATTDASCISNAEALACQYAAKNGFNSCTPGAASASNANVPPLSCSPYDFMDYGNGASNSNCKTASAPTYYDYIEVQLTSSLSSADVPIFNIPVNLYAHAVAKKGTSTPHGYALIALDSQGVSMSGSNQTVIEGSTYSNGPITGDGNDIACGGGWASAGSVTGVATAGTDNLTYSPLGCGSGSGTPLAAQNQPRIQDPYAGSVPPTASVFSGSGSTCPECASAGYWYDLVGNVWGQGGQPSGAAVAGGGGKGGGGPGGKGPGGGKTCDHSIEMFPGVYSTLPTGNMYCVYMNPGVYTFDAPVDPALLPAKEHVATLCVFGSPSCDSIDNKHMCEDVKFSNGLDGGDNWMYQCAPWGFWDNSSFGGTRPAGLPVTPPTWYNAATSSWTSAPFNGVTLYFPANSQNPNNVGITTHEGTSSQSYLAAPNPCPGTGSRFTAGASVQFPDGNSAASYTYPATSPVTLHGVTDQQTYTGGSSPYSLVYSNDDITQLGECHLPYVEWPSAMPVPQHINFLIYESDPMTNAFYGTDDLVWSGVIYNPAGSITFTGKTGDEGSSGAEGLPWLTGQVVTGHVDFHGTSSVQIAYLPCTPGSPECSNGAGAALVE